MPGNPKEIYSCNICGLCYDDFNIAFKCEQSHGEKETRHGYIRIISK